MQDPDNLEFKRPEALRRVTRMANTAKIRATEGADQREPAAAKKFPVVEIFGPTIQGEGFLCGTVSYFIRFGGCSYRCSWCDSLHAVLPELVKSHARWLDVGSIVSRLQGLERKAYVAPGSVKIEKLPRGTWVTISGGDPVLWRLDNLVTDLHGAGFRVAVETQGALYRPWLLVADFVTISPKPPSSGMAEQLDEGELAKYLTILNPQKRIFKVVIFDKVDLDWAEELHLKYPRVKMYLSVGTPKSEPGSVGAQSGLNNHILTQLTWLAEAVCRRPALADTSVLPQMHALMWGHDLGR